MPRKTKESRMNLRDLIEAIPDAAAISISTKTTLGAGASGLFASVAQWNWTAIVASTVAIVGLGANLYFQRRRDRREREDARRREELHQAQLAALKERCEL